MVLFKTGKVIVPSRHSYILLGSTDFFLFFFCVVRAIGLGYCVAESFLAGP